jgi:hypothetical protein
VGDYNFSELFTLTEKGEKFLDDFKNKFVYQPITRTTRAKLDYEYDQARHKLDCMDCSYQEKQLMILLLTKMVNNIYNQMTRGGIY